jgi:predicted O-methyltransferase YrrM
MNIERNINYSRYSKKDLSFNFFSFIKFLYILLSLILLVILLIKMKEEKAGENRNSEKYIDLDKYETNIYNNINNNNLLSCSRMSGNQREFLNGVVRKFKPKKILEIGVAEGGSSIIILNAIKDLKNSHLFSIDLSKNEMIGYCVKNLFNNLSNKWSLYTGNIPAKFMKKIGKNIEMAFIDSAHLEPGEILDFLIILPFLKEEAIIIFHDIANQITKAGGKNTRRNWAPYKIFNMIRGNKFYPSGNNILTKEIGAIKLSKNQFTYIHDYFRALGGQWDYFPEEEHIDLIRKLIKIYYDNDCLVIFEEAIKFNRIFLRNNPLKTNTVYSSKTKKSFLKKSKKYKTFILK